MGRRPTRQMLPLSLRRPLFCLSEETPGMLVPTPREFWRQLDENLFLIELHVNIPSYQPLLLHYCLEQGQLFRLFFRHSRLFAGAEITFVCP